MKFIEFQRGSVPHISDYYLWYAQQGNWSLLIIGEDITGPYICSYQQNDMVMVIFKDEQESCAPEEVADVPKEYHFHSLASAKIACEDKYKELLLR